MKRISRLLNGGACLVATFALAACAHGEAHEQEAPPVASNDGASMHFDPNSPAMGFVKIGTVAKSDVPVAALLTGQVAFDEDHTQRVASPLDGRATRLLVKLGDHVRGGQVLVELVAPAAGQLQADAQKSAQDLELAKRSLDRANVLKADGAVSEKELAQLESDYRKARADVARTETALRSFGLSASEPTISAALRTQISGTVVERNVLVGQEIRADAPTPLFTVSDLDTVWVLADVYEQDLSLVHVGDEVSVTVAAYPSEVFAGKVGHIGDVVDPQSRTVKIRCVVPNAGARLKPAMFAKITIKDAGEHQVVEIPSKAVISEAKQSKVLVIDGDVLKARAVDVGPDIDGMVRVLSGLKVGDRIVLEGALFLKSAIDSR